MHGLTKNGPREEIADYAARPDEFSCWYVLPFLTFALSLSLGEMGVLRMLSESGADGFTALCFFVFDETPVKSSRFWSAALTDHHSLNFSLGTRLEAGSTQTSWATPSFGRVVNFHLHHV